jgi:hypothetical protein
MNLWLLDVGKVTGVTDDGDVIGRAIQTAAESRDVKVFHLHNNPDQERH